MKKRVMKKKGIIGTILLFVFFIVEMIFLIYCSKADDLYIAGTVWGLDSLQMLFLVQMAIPMCISNRQRIKRLKEENNGKGSESSAHTIKKLNRLSFIILFVAVICVVIAVVEDVKRIRKDYMIEEKIGNAGSILLVENETSTKDNSHEIIIYSKRGIRLKRIGDLGEYSYVNKQMIENGQYKLEYNGDVVTIYYYHGGIEGAKQKDDEKDESEEFLKRDYQIE